MSRRTCDRCDHDGSEKLIQETKGGQPWRYDALYQILCIGCVEELEGHLEEMSYLDPLDKPDLPNDNDNNLGHHEPYSRD